MNPVHELLAQKELELAQVASEVDALRVVAPLLDHQDKCVREAAEPIEWATSRKSRSVHGSDSPQASRMGRWRETAKRWFPGMFLRRHA